MTTWDRLPELTFDQMLGCCEVRRYVIVFHDFFRHYSTAHVLTLWLVLWYEWTDSNILLKLPVTSLKYPFSPSFLQRLKPKKPAPGYVQRVSHSTPSFMKVKKQPHPTWHTFPFKVDVFLKKNKVLLIGQNSLITLKSLISSCTRQNKAFWKKQNKKKKTLSLDNYRKPAMQTGSFKNTPLTT